MSIPFFSQIIFQLHIFKQFWKGEWKSEVNYIYNCINYKNLYIFKTMTFLSTFVAALPKIAPILTFCSQQIIQLIMYSLEYFLEEILTNTLKKIYYMFSIFCFLYFLLHIHISLYMYSGLYACCVCNVYAPFSPSERQDQIGSHFSGNP